MLILKRSLNEEISILGGLIRIQVVEVRGNSVRLGIEAPPSIDVHRKEVQETIEAENPALAQEALERRSELLTKFFSR